MHEEPEALTTNLIVSNLDTFIKYFVCKLDILKPVSLNSGFNLSLTYCEAREYHQRFKISHCDEVDELCCKFCKQVKDPENRAVIL